MLPPAKTLREPGRARHRFALPILLALAARPAPAGRAGQFTARSGFPACDVRRAVDPSECV